MLLKQAEHRSCPVPLGIAVTENRDWARQGGHSHAANGPAG